MSIQNSFLISAFKILIFLIILEGLVCQPNIGRWGIVDTDGSMLYEIYIFEDLRFSTFDFCQKSYFFSNFWNENGFVEIMQSLILLISIIFLFKARKNFLQNKMISIFLTIKILALIYYLGEEVSWGQHFFKWDSHEWFKIYNNQNETNLHNISNLFDQVPRTLVLIWCALIAPITLLAINYIKIDKNTLKILCPDKKLLIISISLLFLVVPDLLIDKFDLHPGWTDSNGFRLNNYSYFFDMISFNFIRLSELHELFFAFYFLIYSNSFKNKNI
jgi:hypothetical protein